MPEAKQGIKEKGQSRMKVGIFWLRIRHAKEAATRIWVCIQRRIAGFPPRHEDSGATPCYPCLDACVDILSIIRLSTVYYLRETTVSYSTTMLLVLIFISTMSAEPNQQIKKEPFGKAGDQPVELYTLTNANGVEAKIITYGARVVSLKAPDREGKLADVVLGCENVDCYISDPYFGAIVGRYANRIGKGRFSLNGKEYTLPKNDGENTLHGGIKNFSRVVWTAKEAKSSSGEALSLSYFSKDGEEGFPGNLTATVLYTLTNKTELRIDYSATTDRKTVVNLSGHSYFNLAGSGSILNHVMMINASRFTPVDSGLIPTGELRSVKGTPMDFTAPTRIDARIDDPYEQLVLGKGYDHNWVLDSGGGKLALAARVSEPTTGRVLEVHTTEPGIQFYTGNFLDGSIKGKGGQVYQKRYGFCLETQHFPDSPNKPSFPSTVLHPGKTFRTTTIYKFSAS
jgi:aldose 1-epimerase